MWDLPLDGTDLPESGAKRQYNRDFLLGFQFMPACIQKPEGLPPISDVVLDKVSEAWLTHSCMEISDSLPQHPAASRVTGSVASWSPAY